MFTFLPTICLFKTDLPGVHRHFTITTDPLKLKPDTYMEHIPCWMQTAVKCSLLSVYLHSEGLSLKSLRSPLSLSACDITAHFTLQAHLDFCSAPKRPFHSSKQLKPNCLNQWIASEMKNTGRVNASMLTCKISDSVRSSLTGTEHNGFHLWATSTDPNKSKVSWGGSVSLAKRGQFRLWSLLWWDKAE